MGRRRLHHPVCQSFTRRQSQPLQPSYGGDDEYGSTPGSRSPGRKQMVISYGDDDADRFYKLLVEI
uniref:Uncharacterized protein n=1 Tax=Oryza glumipatula TaxID=40148 RepID=A0A0E0A7U3_9ORYZ